MLTLDPNPLLPFLQSIGLVPSSIENQEVHFKQLPNSRLDRDISSLSVKIPRRLTKQIVAEHSAFLPPVSLLRALPYPHS